MASADPQSIEYINATDRLVAIIKHLSQLGHYIILDIGSNILPGIDSILTLCNEMILAVEPMPNTVNRTRLLIEVLADKGFTKSRVLTLVLINRIRSDIQLS